MLSPASLRTAYSDLGDGVEGESHGFFGHSSGTSPYMHTQIDIQTTPKVVSSLGDTS